MHIGNRVRRPLCIRRQTEGGRERRCGKQGCLLLLLAGFEEFGIAVQFRRFVTELTVVDFGFDSNLRDLWG